MKEAFRRISEYITEIMGSVYALLAAILIIVVWAVTGPLFHFNDTWLLLINTVTTIVTFLMVFIIQSSYNRESKATQLKLNEIIRAIEGARNTFMGLEKEPDDKLHQLEIEVLKDK